MATNEREHELEGLLIGRGLLRRRRIRRLLAHLLRKRRAEGGEGLGDEGGRSRDAS